MYPLTGTWREQFAPHILARGEGYFQEGRVRSLRQEGGEGWYISHIS